MKHLVLDTHALVWLLFDSSRLSQVALAAVNQAIDEGYQVIVPSICLVEIQYLIEKGRVDAALWPLLLEELSDRESGLILVELTLEVAKSVGFIHRSVVPDMPDRIIAATAHHLNFPLVTRDRRIAASGVPTIW